jgi:hypothetical protein
MVWDMARGKKADAPVEPDYTVYADKEPTDLQSRFGEWVIDKTGIEFSTKKEEAAFKEGVRLGTALRMQFQASPENQEVLEARKAAVEERKAAPKPATKKRGRPKAEVEPDELDEEPEEDDEEDDDIDDAAPAPKPSRKAPARTRKAPAAKPTATRTRRKAAVAAKSGDAPF